MPIVPFIAYSTAGAFLWSALLVYAGTILGDNWTEIRHLLQPFDLAIAVGVVALVVGFIWWRLGMPGKPGRSNPAEPSTRSRPSSTEVGMAGPKVPPDTRHRRLRPIVAVIDPYRTGTGGQR